MKPLLGHRVPKRPWMALCTAEYVSLNTEIKWADFKDTHALFFPKAQRFVGYNRDGMLLIGKPELVMVDGLWLLEEDPELIQKFKDEPAINLMLSIIK